MDEIRTLRNEELDDSIALSCFAFQYDLTTEEWEKRKRQTTPDTIWGYFEEGKLAAKVQIHPMQTYIQGRAFRMGGVASVATWPEYRRKGMVSQLLSRGLQAMKENGQTVSFLSPFSVSFYRKYGWELYTDNKIYDIEMSKLAGMPTEFGSMVRADGDWELLNRVYDPFAKLYNGMLIRDQSWWLDKLFPKKGSQASVYFDESGEPRGYVLYKVKNRIMEIGEMAYLDTRAWLSLWSFIRNHDSMCDRVKLKAPSDDELSYMLPNPWIKPETMPYFMARIVDVKAFLEQYPFAETGTAAKLKLEVSDTRAPWNDGTFEVAVDGSGRANVSRAAAIMDVDGIAEASAGASASEAAGGGFGAALKCDIGTLTAMLLGYKRPKLLQRLGKLEIDDDAGVELLELLVPQRSTFMPDYF